MFVRNIGLFMFTIFVGLSVLYLIPPFTFDFNGKRYVYEGLPTLVDARSYELNIDTAGNTGTYKYIVKSVSAPSSKEELHSLVAKDLQIFEERLRNYVGNNFEIRSDIQDGGVTYTFLLNKSLEQSTNLLTSTNSDFEIRALKTVNTVDSTNQNSTPQYETLNLQRNDFGFAELLDRQSTNNFARYEVALPLSLFISPDKINFIREKLNTALQVSVAGSEWQAYFDYNQSYVPTRLVLTGIPNRAQAILIRGFLNTEPTSLSYNLESVHYVEYKWYRTLLPYMLMTLAMIVALVIDFVKNRSVAKLRIFPIFGLMLILLASLKLLNQTLSVTVALMVASAVILTILSTSYVYLLYFFGLVSFIKLLTLLKGWDVSMLTMVILVIFTILLSLVNYNISLGKKYALFKFN